LKVSKIHILIISTTLIISLAGCVAQNAEHKIWNTEGRLIEQTRTGFVALLYWLGVEYYEVKNKEFSATTQNAIAKPDPNSIKATGEATGKVINASIGIGELSWP
jgi:hypothetical protein